MTAPLRMSFDVDCSAEHAFAVWTTGIGTWWPADHTVTGEAGLDVVMQSGVGGRIYERTPSGAEHAFAVWTTGIGRAVHVERHPQRRGHDPGSSVLPAWPPLAPVLPTWLALASVFSVFSASSRKRAAASPQTRSRYSRTASIPRSCRW